MAKALNALASMNPLAAEDMRYRARDAMHTIARAEEHKRDGELMKHVRALAADVHKAVGAETQKGDRKARRSTPADPAGAAAKTKGSVVAKAQAPQATRKGAGRKR